MKQFYKWNNLEAVSPVIGVMLMLVVTIIIASVVSGFSGSLYSEQEEAPSISLDTHIRNDGTTAGSYVEMQVKSVSEPISTKDLRITTSWKTSMKNNTVYDPSHLNISELYEISTGTDFTGGETIIGTTENTHYAFPNGNTYYLMNSPVGYGMGVNQTLTTMMLVSSDGRNDYSFYPDQNFGNYTLMGGTIMHASPVTLYGCTKSFGQGEYNYPLGGSVYYNPAEDMDQMQAILGKGWENLRAGDSVTIQVVHIPSEKVIYNQNIVVEG